GQQDVLVRLGVTVLARGDGMAAVAESLTGPVVTGADKPLAAGDWVRVDALRRGGCRSWAGRLRRWPSGACSHCPPRCLPGVTACALPNRWPPPRRRRWNRPPRSRALTWPSGGRRTPA